MRFLVVQPMTPELRETGKRLICADAAGAGAGELVYWVRGREACFPFLPKEVASDATIVGIVDELNVARLPQGDLRQSSDAPPTPPRKNARKAR
jgi:microcompartment protein CcmK/EutM